MHSAKHSSDTWGSECVAACGSLTSQCCRQIFAPIWSTLFHQTLILCNAGVMLSTPEHCLCWRTTQAVGRVHASSLLLLLTEVLLLLLLSNSRGWQRSELCGQASQRIQQPDAAGQPGGIGKGGDREPCDEGSPGASRGRQPHVFEVKWCPSKLCCTTQRSLCWCIPLLRKSNPYVSPSMAMQQLRNKGTGCSISGGRRLSGARQQPQS